MRKHMKSVRKNIEGDYSKLVYDTIYDLVSPSCFYKPSSIFLDIDSMDILEQVIDEFEEETPWNQ
jgi:hypothetical protein